MKRRARRGNRQIQKKAPASGQPNRSGPGGNKTPADDIGLSPTVKTADHKDTSKPPTSTNSEHIENERQLVKWTRRVARLTGALVFVGIVTAIILVVHAVIFHQADETARQSQRAFVIPSEPVITPTVVNGDTPYWKISPVMENTGASSTVGMRYYLGLMEKTPLPYIKGGVSDPDGVDIEFSSLPSMVTLGPKSRFTPTTLVVTKEQAASLREGKLTSYILGEIIYDDVFDAPHHAIFCYVLLGGTGNSGNIGLYGTHLVSVFQTNELSFRLCRRNNCTDKECGKIPRDKPSTENPSIGDRK